MRRLARHLFTFFAATSLLLCVAACAASLRADWKTDGVIWLRHDRAVGRWRATSYSVQINGMGLKFGSVTETALSARGAQFHSDVGGWHYTRQFVPCDRIEITGPQPLGFGW